MESNFQIHPYLVSVADMEEFEDEAELAADQLNLMLHNAAEQASAQDWSEDHIVELIEELCFIWFREPSLTELDSDEIEDYVSSVVRRMEQQRDDENDNLNDE
ncbi:hypothetical protein [Aliidiomarina maris]|uniref:Uncharacterized protein n=1 Tax=Aliidiomarina maris TaxID=531312 RepID=A0A327X184_9GAMM|nr:hypothetical protein [Aliidiomarina maris]MBA3987562.1 hypothetical protein [Idiomarina sp.]MCL5051473.1 hypothetical protein [Bacillota bacterium]RAJ98948.1 hypothetical protein B0I24_104152 [Aliidiomarina maris]RUO25091.1 hypothetical protein CWE07_06330 [Aliidiomarina maris]